MARDTHIIDGEDRGGKPLKNPERVRQVMKEVSERMPELPVFAGHRIRPHEMRAFEAYIQHGDYGKAAKEIGVDKRTVAYWAKTAWWKELIQAHFNRANHDLAAKIADRDEKLLRAYDRVINAENPNDRTANAVANLIKTRMEMGDDPLIKRKANQYTQINTSGNVAVNQGTILTDRQLSQMTSDEMIQLAQFGDVPERLKEEAVDAEYTEVDESDGKQPQ